MADLERSGVVHAGDPTSIAYSIQAADGTAVDVVGGSARWTLRAFQGQPPYGVVGEELLAKATPAGITLAPSGLVTVLIAAGDIPGPTQGAHYCELEVTLPSGAVRTVKHLIDVSPSVLN